MVTLNGLARVLSFMSLFKQQPSKLYIVDLVGLKVGLLDRYCYVPEVDQFIQALY